MSTIRDYFCLVCCCRKNAILPHGERKFQHHPTSNRPPSTPPTLATSTTPTTPSQHPTTPHGDHHPLPPTSYPPNPSVLKIDKEPHTKGFPLELLDPHSFVALRTFCREHDITQRYLDHTYARFRDNIEAKRLRRRRTGAHAWCGETGGSRRPKAKVTATPSEPKLSDTQVNGCHIEAK